MFDGIVLVLDKKYPTWTSILRAESMNWFLTTTPPCAKATTQNNAVTLTHTYHPHHHHVNKFIRFLQRTILVTNLAKHSGFISGFTAWLTLSCILLGHYEMPSHTHCWATKGTVGEDREFGVRNKSISIPFHIITPCILLISSSFCMKFLPLQNINQPTCESILLLMQR